MKMEVGMSEEYVSEKKKEEHFAKIEEYIRLRIRLKPVWMPLSLWHWLLHRILVMEYWK